MGAGSKAFCDACQDLEEERAKFICGRMPTPCRRCVLDNEVRVCLRHLSGGSTHFTASHARKCVSLWSLKRIWKVRDYGTENAIPEPPMFVNYANIHAPLVSSGRIVTRPSSFIRATQRPRHAASLTQDDEACDDTNHDGVGAGSSGVAPRNTAVDAAALSRSAAQKSTTSPRSQTNGVNGYVPPTLIFQPQRRRNIAPVTAQPASAGILLTRRSPTHSFLLVIARGTLTQRPANRKDRLR